MITVTEVDIRGFPFTLCLWADPAARFETRPRICHASLFSNPLKVTVMWCSKRFSSISVIFILPGYGHAGNLVGSRWDANLPRLRSRMRLVKTLLTTVLSWCVLRTIIIVLIKCNDATLASASAWCYGAHDLLFQRRNIKIVFISRWWYGKEYSM